MDCEYWKDVVAQLRDRSRCVWASHVISTLLPSEAGLEGTNLGAVLKCVPPEEMIEGTIYAYRNWSAQPSCDLILAEFNPEEVLGVFRTIKHPETKMKVGVLWLLEDMSPALAVELASSLNNPDEEEKVLEVVRLTLSAT